MFAGQRLQQPFAAVVTGIRAEPVGLVVGDVPAAVMLKGQVDKALEKAAQGVELQACRRLAQRGRQAAGRIAQQRPQPRHVELKHRKGEAQFRQAPLRAQAGQGHSRTIQIGIQHLLQLTTGNLGPFGWQSIGLQARFDPFRQRAFAPHPVFQNRVQTGAGARTTRKGEETTARLGGVGHGQGITVRCLHVHPGGQTGEAADAPGAVKAAVQLRQLSGR